MKLGLDLHGTIDAHRLFFAEWTSILASDNARQEQDGLDLSYRHEVHIMTGPELKDIRADELYGIWYTHFFSIVAECKHKSIAVVYDKKGDPWIDQYEWNKAKADYAREQKLDLVIDDSTIYPNFYNTPCAIFKSGKEWMNRVI